MTHDYGAKLAAINWAKLDPIDAQAIYTLTVTACRATRGGCFCGCHVTPLDETRPAPELPRNGEQCAACGEPKRDHGACGKADNFACNTYVAPASRKVEPGTTLTVGARYRITEIASWDEDPEHKVGDELYAVEDAFNAGGLESSVFRDRHSRHWKAHTHESCTYVTGLELVAEPVEGE